jgi:arylsulfatase
MTTGDVGIAFDDDLWELYDGSADWTQSRDLAKEQPEMLHELQRLFLIEATRHNVLPLDDRGFERVLPEASGKPELVGTKQILLPGMGGLTELHLVNTRNRSWSLTSEVVIPKGGANGVILKVGGHIGGWSLYLAEGKPTYCYNLFGLQRFYTRAADEVSPGEHQIRVEFSYDGGGIGKGGGVTLYLDGHPIGTGRIDHTEPIGFGSVYTDVGRDDLAPVTDEYPATDNAFTGTIKWIEIEAGDDSHDHLIDPEDFIRFAMAKQ